MKRTGERVLGIISVILNIISFGFILLMIYGTKILVNDPLFTSEIEDSMYSSGLSDAEVQEGMFFMQEFIPFISNIGWLFVVLSIISIILAIIGTIKATKNSKLAGILFIIAGVLSGIISLSGILLLIAGIMCLVRKPKTPDIIQKTDDNGYIIE